MDLVLDLTKVDREKALRTWLTYHGICEKKLAEEVGVSPSAITRIIKGERASRNLVERLVAAGIPRSLLPTPGPGPGRPART
ncbi:helix-turn-helix domain protein [Desulfovibrio sp. X2]|uniref:helix-turn-helix domain-containing protein n=1 Tax=Desulfovibrio sp. X2 TaxID=941449 RepID=UPI000358B34F|nr:helix-turn-helix transcriptional regulator [Desulfovibrio sp. X2]EPR42772.1 helix-turn-helix domain protein [Desulfovibrio sp. X2]